jgi:hypothetical protein
MIDLPEDLCSDLASGFQFDCNFDSSEIGKTELFSLSELTLSNAPLNPQVEVCEHDEYYDLNGHYLVPTYNLAKKNEDYDAEGLLAYFPTFKKFGFYDTEHDAVKILKNKTWSEIKKSPIQILELQWEDSRHTFEPCPWPGFDYSANIEGVEYIFKGYHDKCEIHNQSINKTEKDFLKFDDLDLTIKFPDLFKVAQKDFPYSGQQIDANHEICCIVCKDKEENFVLNNSKPKTSLLMITNEMGFLKCPACNIHFKYNDPNAFNRDKHACGQKLIIKLHESLEKT